MRRGSAPIIVAMACLSAGTLARTAWLARHGPPLAPDDARFAALRQALPGRGTVGYISDAAPDDPAGRLFRAQYSLAPVILVRGGHKALVVVDASRPELVGDLLRGNRLRPIRDFGNGVVLATEASP
ncbi:MAG: hypothetical protein LAP87_17370 [Acidobacteriia bacterium]|nr:hypothetical protein [Terriglobia bacterium]